MGLSAALAVLWGQFTYVQAATESVAAFADQSIPPELLPHVAVVVALPVLATGIWRASVVMKEKGYTADPMANSLRLLTGNPWLSIVAGSLMGVLPSNLADAPGLVSWWTGNGDRIFWLTEISKIVAGTAMCVGLNELIRVGNTEPIIRISAYIEDRTVAACSWVNRTVLRGKGDNLAKIPIIGERMFSGRVRILPREQEL